MMDRSRAAAFEAAYPDRLVATCSRDQAVILAPFDHHRVRVGGRDGVMLTYEWLLADACEPLLLTVVPHHAAAHPPAPPEIQSVIDQLAFRPPVAG